MKLILTLKLKCLFEINKYFPPYQYAIIITMTFRINRWFFRDITRGEAQQIIQEPNLTKGAFFVTAVDDRHGMHLCDVVCHCHIMTLYSLLLEHIIWISWWGWLDCSKNNNDVWTYFREETKSRVQCFISKCLISKWTEM